MRGVLSAEVRQKIAVQVARDLNEVADGRQMAEAQERAKAQVRSEHPDQLLVFGGHSCDKSPTKSCVYAHYDDPCHDDCLYCGNPEERK